MTFERFLMGNILNSMLQAYETLVRGLTCLKKLVRLYGNHSLPTSPCRGGGGGGGGGGGSKTISIP